MVISGQRNNTSALRNVLLPLAIVAVFSAGGYGVYAYMTHKTAVLPASIQTKLTFSPLVVDGNSQDFTSSDFKSSKVEDGTELLSFLVHTASGNTVSVSEYTQPPQFTDIPEYKSRFLSNVAKQYDTVQTSNGVIYLGRQAKNNNKQLAVMLEKGLVIFMAPDKEIDNTQWRKLGDQLELQEN